MNYGLALVIEFAVFDILVFIIAMRYIRTFPQLALRPVEHAAYTLDTIHVAVQRGEVARTIAQYQARDYRTIGVTDQGGKEIIRFEKYVWKNGNGQ
jgi:hypothetical protein